MNARRLPTTLRGVTSIVAGSIAGQGLVILSYPLLTRLYDPAELGLLTVFTSVIGMLSVISTASLEAAIPIPPEDGEAADVAWSALAVVMGTTLVTAVVGLLAANPLAQLLGVPALARYWWLVALTVLAIGTYLVLSEWMVRDRTYGALGRRNLLQGVGQTATQVGLGLAGVRPLGLLLGLAVSRLVALGGLLSSNGLLRQRRAKRQSDENPDEERVLERLSQDSIVDALAEVPHDFRDVVVLVDIGEFSYADAAQILDIPIGTVMSRLHRGRRILKKNLADGVVAT